MTTATTNTQAMAVHWELTRLNNAFAFYLDNGAFESMIGLFTPDGLFDRAGIVHRGQDEMREGMAERPKVTTRHLLTNFHLTSVDDTGRWRRTGKRWSTPLTTVASSSSTTGT
jgi:hypothetical protein